MTCGYCGDVYEMPPAHDCWLARKYALQEVLEPEQGGYLEIGQAPEDDKVPVLIRQVDISNY